MKRTHKLVLSLAISMAAGFVVYSIAAHAVTQDGKNDSPTHIMQTVRIVGKIERPEAVYIIDVTAPNFRPIRIDRSFHDEMLEPLDKEEFEAGIKPGEERKN
jgi:hypothetical protein